MDIILIQKRSSIALANFIWIGEATPAAILMIGCERNAS